jgi:hypothetical protein
MFRFVRGDCGWGLFNEAAGHARKGGIVPHDRGEPGRPPPLPVHERTIDHIRCHGHRRCPPPRDGREHILFNSLRFIAGRHPELHDELERSLDHLWDHAATEPGTMRALREIARRFLKSLRAES